MNDLQRNNSTPIEPTTSSAGTIESAKEDLRRAEKALDAYVHAVEHDDAHLKQLRDVVKRARSELLRRLSLI